MYSMQKMIWLGISLNTCKKKCSDVTDDLSDEIEFICSLCNGNQTMESIDIGSGTLLCIDECCYQDIHKLPSSIVTFELVKDVIHLPTDRKVTLHLKGRWNMLCV